MIIKLNDEQAAYVNKWWPHFGTVIVANDLGLDSASIKRYVDINKLHILDKPLRLCTVCRVNYQRPNSASGRRHPAKCIECASGDRKVVRAINDRSTRAKMTFEDYFRVSANTLNYRNKTRYGVSDRITFLDLINMYKEQDGKCFYSGIELFLPYGDNISGEFGTAAGSMNPNTISFDRYDSGIAYTKDNIRLCTYQVNVAKNAFTAEQFTAMCASVTSHSR